MFSKNGLRNLVIKAHKLKSNQSFFASVAVMLSPKPSKSDSPGMLNLFRSPGNLKGNPAISGSGPKRCGPKANGWNPWCRTLDLGSLGPSTVTLMAFV